jgi:putative endonuclease
MNIGAATEAQAVELYKKEGYKVLAQNYRYYSIGRGQKAELDIIATQKNLLVCVEVKYRKPGSLVSALQSITPRKIKLMQSCILDFIKHNKHYSNYLIRFDAVVVDGTKLEILKNIVSF